MRRWTFMWWWGMAVLIGLPGCAIWNTADKCSADLDVGLGGAISYIGDVRIKASVGFEKQHPEKEVDNAAPVDLPDPLGIWGFL